jgi:hypothetical protein
MATTITHVHAHIHEHTPFSKEDPYSAQPQPQIQNTAGFILEPTLVTHKFSTLPIPQFCLPQVAPSLFPVIIAFAYTPPLCHMIASQGYGAIPRWGLLEVRVERNWDLLWALACTHTVLGCLDMLKAEEHKERSINLFFFFPNDLTQWTSYLRITWRAS